MSILPKSTQVLVVGGGPAGSTAATLLAREGFDVTLMEKAVGPRYHIGESLLPSSMEIFDLLGVREKVEAYGFQRKGGAYLEWGTENWTLDFGQLKGNHKYSFQVRRAELDKLLLDHASSQGAKVFEGVEIRDLSFDGDRPRSANWSQGSTGSSGELSFDFLIDASGRSGLMATRYLLNRQTNKVFQNVAVWGYWKGASKLQKGPDGAIGVGSIKDGWLWAIPLDDDTLSVGVVIHKTAYKAKRSAKLEEFYLNAIAECPLVADLLVQAGLVSNSVEVEQDYSYAAESFCGPGYFLVGDAACFLDPLLSTGVHLANFSALLASASIASVLRNEVTENQASSFYERSFRQSYLRLLMLVSALYDQKRGKESYFREAQQLTQNDYKGAEMNRAFLHLASGIEDLSEAEEGIQHQITEEISKRVAANLALKQDMPSLSPMPGENLDGAVADPQFMGAMEGMFSFSAELSAEAAVDGFYVTTKPKLGLGRAPEGVEGRSSSQFVHS